MKLPLKIATRYFFSRKSSGGFNAVSVISGISLLGYAVGAAALIIVLSVFNGFENLFVNMYSSFDADVQITAAKGKTFNSNTLNISAIKSMEGIEHVSFVLEENVLLRYDNKQTIASVKGVDESYLQVTHLDSNIVRGVLQLQNNDTNYALVGQGLAYQLGIDPDDQFTYLGVYAPRKGRVDMLNPEGSFARQIIFAGGVFAVQDEVDSKYIIVPLAFLKKLLDKESEISSLEIRLKEGYDMDKIKNQLVEMCGTNFSIKNRFEQRDSFFKVMKSEKTYSYIILVFILLIAAFNSIGSLYMLVIEKKKDLHVFSSLGLKANAAAAIFRFEGMLVALAGGLLGMFLAFVFCLLQQKYGLIGLNSSGSFVINAYPIAMQWLDFVLVFFTLLALGFVTSVYPAYKAKRLVQ